jgi:hypothetical protein
MPPLPSPPSRTGSGLLALGVASVMLLGSLQTLGDDLQVQARLVWGTNNPKPEGSKYTALDPKGREKLRQFKWQNYWVVTQAISKLDTQKPSRMTLSEKCAVDVKDLGNGTAEIRLFELKPGTEPKLVKPVHHSVSALKKGEYCILAGDDKSVWDDAWFVIVTAVEPKH